MSDNVVAFPIVARPVPIKGDSPESRDMLRRINDMAYDGLTANDADLAIERIRKLLYPGPTQVFGKKD